MVKYCAPWSTHNPQIALSLRSPTPGFLSNSTTSCCPDSRARRCQPGIPISAIIAFSWAQAFLSPVEDGSGSGYGLKLPPRVGETEICYDLRDACWTTDSNKPAHTERKPDSSTKIQPTARFMGAETDDARQKTLRQGFVRAFVKACAIGGRTQSSKTARLFENNQYPQSTGARWRRAGQI